MVYTRRRRMEENAEREAAGESLWTPEFDARALRRLGTLYSILDDKLGQAYRVHEAVADKMKLEGGWAVGDYLEPSDLIGAHQLSTDWILDALECIGAALDEVRAHKAWERSVNEILNEHRIAFRMVEGEAPRVLCRSYTGCGSRLRVA